MITITSTRDDDDCGFQRRMGGAHMTWAGRLLVQVDEFSVFKNLEAYFSEETNTVHGMNRMTRLLRSVKNRFGPSNEIGVFEMEAGGLDDVADPSMLFLSTKHVDGDGGDEV